MSGNTKYGDGALENNVDGSNSCAIGMCALQNNDASWNTCVGAYAGTENTTGISNVAVGTNALFLNEIGSYNTAVGTGSLLNNLGDSNTSFGSNTLGNNITGEENTSVGVQSGFNNAVGHKNTFVGSYSGFNNINGSENTFVGYRSGYDMSSARYNTFIGANTGTSEASVVYSTAIGYNAIVDTSHTVVLGTSKEMVKILGELRLQDHTPSSMTTECLVLAQANNNNRVGFTLNPVGGAYNYITQANDNLLAFGDVSLNPTSLVIAPWSNTANGIRMTENTTMLGSGGTTAGTTTHRLNTDATQFRITSSAFKVDGNMTQISTSSASRQIFSSYYNMANTSSTTTPTSSRMFHTANTTYLINETGNPANMFFGFTLPVPVQIMNLTPSTATINGDIVIDGSDNYLQFPDGTRQTTAYTGDPIDVAYLNANYLKFPSAQGTETFGDINVNALATFNSTSQFNGNVNVGTNGIDCSGNLLVVDYTGSQQDTEMVVFASASTTGKLGIVMNPQPANFNPIVRGDDTVMSFGQNSGAIANFCIAPWSSTACGLRVTKTDLLLGAGGTTIVGDPINPTENIFFDGSNNRITIKSNDLQVNGNLATFNSTSQFNGNVNVGTNGIDCSGNVSIVDYTASEALTVCLVLAQANNNNRVAFTLNPVGGAYNFITKENDNAMIFGEAGFGPTSLVIAPWSTTANGIRMTENTIMMGSGGTTGDPPDNRINTDASQVRITSSNFNVDGCINLIKDGTGIRFPDNTLQTTAYTKIKVGYFDTSQVLDSSSVYSNTFNGPNLTATLPDITADNVGVQFLITNTNIVESMTVFSSNYQLIYSNGDASPTPDIELGRSYSRIFTAIIAAVSPTTYGWSAV